MTRKKQEEFQGQCAIAVNNKKWMGVIEFDSEKESRPTSRISPFLELSNRLTTQCNVIHGLTSSSSNNWRWSVAGGVFAPCIRFALKTTFAARVSMAQTPSVGHDTAAIRAETAKTQTVARISAGRWRRRRWRSIPIDKKVLRRAAWRCTSHLGWGRMSLLLQHFSKHEGVVHCFQLSRRLRWWWSWRGILLLNAVMFLSHWWAPI